MTYKFPQFQIEITNPTISIDLNSIQDKAIDQLLSVGITLSTDNAKFGMISEDMVYINTWEDSEIPDMVNTWLVQFEI